ncbi:MAG: hypothetical protein HY702_05195 [Gemmatimonadetes bacterium]|nr:hypothetical protein [Gemmatimonadota bacterium]
MRTLALSSLLVVFVWAAGCGGEREVFLAPQEPQFHVVGQTDPTLADRNGNRTVCFKELEHAAGGVEHRTQIFIDDRNGTCPPGFTPVSF